MSRGLDVALIARLAADGLNDHQIGAQLGARPGTVQATRSRHGIPSPLGRHCEVLHRPDAKAVAASLAALTPRNVALTYDEEGMALCAQTDPDAFFPDSGGSVHEAMQVCAGCPLTRIEDGGSGRCLDVALANGERFGVWGGTSERERRRMLHERQAVAS